MADQPSDMAHLSSSVSVIGSEFMAPYQFDIKVDIYSSGNFVVTDTNNKIILKVKPYDTSFHYQRVLLDADDKPIAVIRKKILTEHHRWNVFRGDSKSKSNKIFTTQTPNIIQFKTSVHVFLANKASSKRICDFKIKGSWSKRNCAIYMGDTSTTIAQMNKMKASEKTKFVNDKFVVTIDANVDYAFVVTLIAIVEAMKTPNKKNRAVAGEAAGGVVEAVIGAVLNS